jgi:hypothetical protein
VQPAHDVAEVAAEDTTVDVELVDDDVLQVLEELQPLGVVRQDRRVEHVGVGDDDVTGLADGGARVGRGVAVVGERPDAAVEVAAELRQLRQLVLGQGLGGEQVEGA